MRIKYKKWNMDMFFSFIDWKTKKYQAVWICSTILDSINKLNDIYSGISAKIIDENNSLHNFVNIFMDGEDVRYMQGVDTKLIPGSEISIVPAVAGGF